MYKAVTTNVSDNVKACATALRDTRLLAKLARSDMHALNAVYHKPCIVALYNRMRKHLHTQSPSSETSMSVEALALAELASSVEGSGNNDGSASMFKLSDLVKLYSSRLKEMGCDIENRVNSTRLD